jgi:phosphomannomutase
MAKVCGIRGPAVCQLPPEQYQRWGRALGAQVAARAKFVIGGDAQPTTPECLAALTEGFCEAGANVVNLGVLPSPMVYYAQRRLRADGCAIVTASRDPGEMFGLRWMIGDRPPTADELEAFSHDGAAGRVGKSRRKRGDARPLDVSFDYVAWLQETWVDSLEAQRRIVIDPDCGTFARRARRYLQAIFPHSLFSAIRDEPEAVAAGDEPDRPRQESLVELASAVDHERADLGIAFDGDGDQITFVDDEGVALTIEEAATALLESFDGELAGQSFVYDIRCSERLAQRAGELGARPIAERSSHAAIHARMCEAGAVFGVGASGHYFFRALAGGDDALFAACWMISWLAASGKSLARVRQSCPPLAMTPDLKVHVDPATAAAVLEQIRDAHAQYPQTLVDGLKITFPEGWALVQGRAGRSTLSFRFEASDWLRLRSMVHRFRELLGDVGDDLWRAYTDVLGHPGEGG